MEKFIATIKNHELRGKFLKILGYAFARGSVTNKVELHMTVIRTLYYFRHNGFIRTRVYILYILPYLSKSFSVEKKQQILVNHYNLLQESFNIRQLRLLFSEGLTCYEESDSNDRYAIRLKAVTGHLEFEGSLNLVFECNRSPLYTLGFSFAPGDLFEVKHKQVIFIAAIQGTKNKQEEIRKATRFFKDNDLPVLLMKALEGIAAHLKIATCIGVAASAQLSSDKMMVKEKGRTVYDEFWLKSGGKAAGNGYLIDLPLAHKPIELISQNHRNRVIKKRNKSAAVYAAVNENWRSFPKAS